MRENKPPAFQFYPKDFLSDINVVTMTMEEVGIYITLLSYCWVEGWLPNASTKLQRLCRNPSNWDELWQNVRCCFYEKDGKLYNKRLQVEREKQIQWREKSREGGLKSGEVRRKKKGGSTVVRRVVEPKSNSAVCSLQSSIDKEKQAKEKPIWLPEKEFEDFKKMRKKIKSPMTERAEELLIMRLERLKTEGHDPKELLETAILNSWKGVWPAKDVATTEETPAQSQARLEAEFGKPRVTK